MSGKSSADRALAIEIRILEPVGVGLDAHREGVPRGGYSTATSRSEAKSAGRARVSACAHL